MVLANCLSCFLSNKESLPIATHQNIQHFQLSTDKLDAIRGSVEHYPVYNTLYWLPLREWPDHLKQVPRIDPWLLGHPGWAIPWGQYSLEGRPCICVPHKLPELYPFTDLHGGHQGMEKMQSQAREAIYWSQHQHRYNLTTSRVASFAPSTMLPSWLSQCCCKTSPMAHGRRLQLTTSTTKAKCTSLSVICSVNILFSIKSCPSLPSPCSKKYRNKLHNMALPA